MASIRRLDPLLVNQIAAGEVVERPASVVKELLENALDAGATHIDVALEEGGAALIRIADDGAGIPPEELPLALAPHATSKIRSIDDLSAIGTLGFRGEALASIASVARLSIISRPHDRLEAAALETDGASEPRVRPCAAPPGTTVEVRSLFHNVPARRKFLRTASAELSHCSEQIARVALAHPGVSITQSHQGRVMRRLPATDDRRARIGDFFGPDLAADLIPFESREPDLLVRGWFAPPAASRASGKWQYVFLNGRYIRDREITGFVLREAFRGLIEPARFPVVFLFLTADPLAFDVNVHPTKIEVRWRDAGRVKSQVLAVLRESLLSRDLTPALRPGGSPHAPSSADAAEHNVNDLAARFCDLPGAAGSGTPKDGTGSLPLGRPAGRPFDYLAMRRNLDALYAQAERATSARQPPLTPAESRGEIPVHGPSPSAPEARSPVDSRASGAVSSDSFARGDLSGSRDDASAQGTGDHATPGPGAVRQRFADEMPVGRAIQIHNAYLVCETEDGLVVIDQHALHERILYEELSARMTRGPLESQRLLLPETLDASPEQLAALSGCGDLLGRLGLAIEPFGQNCVAVQAGPSLLADKALRDFVADLLDKLIDAPRLTPEALLNDALAMMACKAAIKAGDPLTAEAVEALLARRHLVDRSSNCPHGRPTTLRLSMRDLERQFKRT